MLVVWATLPTEQDRMVSKECYRSCKKLVDHMGLEMGIFSGSSYFSAIGDCYEECVKERDASKN